MAYPAPRTLRVFGATNTQSARVRARALGACRGHGTQQACALRRAVEARLPTRGFLDEAVPSYDSLSLDVRPPATYQAITSYGNLSGHN